MDRRLATTTLGGPVAAPARSTGTVRWFSPDRGFGFLVPDGDGEDVFVAWSALPGEGFRCLHEGQRVAWESGEDQHGPTALSVSLLGDS